MSRRGQTYKYRTKDDKEFNNKLLALLFVEHKINDRVAEPIPEMELRGNYKGSMPYTVPTFYKDYGIRQLPAKRGQFRREYSIFKILG